MAGALVNTHNDNGYSGMNFGTKVWQVHTGQRGGEFDGVGGMHTNTVAVVISASTGYMVTPGKDAFI